MSTQNALEHVDTVVHMSVLHCSGTNGRTTATELNVLGAGSQMMVTPRAATPTLSSQDINALTPPVRNGTLSTGIAGGPWDPTPAVVNFYRARNEAKGDSAADLSNADIISADAGLRARIAGRTGESGRYGIPTAGWLARLNGTMST